MTPDPFRHRIAIVTGASSGIGRAITIALCRLGGTVVAAARNVEALHSLVQETTGMLGRVVVHPADVTEVDRIRALVGETIEQFERIDILVCNAGIYPRGRAETLSRHDFDRAMAVNFYGSLDLVYEALPHMLRQRSGQIVLMASVDGKKGLRHDAPYSASKYALVGFADVLRQDLHGTGVFVSTILPGRVDTPMIQNLRVPLVSRKISAEKVAGAVIRAIRNKNPETLVPYLSSKAIIVISTIWPALGDWLVRLFRLEGRESK